MRRSTSRREYTAHGSLSASLDRVGKCCALDSLLSLQRYQTCRNFPNPDFLAMAARTLVIPIGHGRGASCSMYALAGIRIRLVFLGHATKYQGSTTSARSNLKTVHVAVRRRCGGLHLRHHRFVITAQLRCGTQQAHISPICCVPVMPKARSG